MGHLAGRQQSPVEAAACAFRTRPVTTMLRHAVQLMWPACLVLFLAACNRGGESSSPIAGQEQPGPMTIDVPVTITAGDEARIIIRAPELADGTPVSVLLTGSYGPRPYTAQVRDGRATISLQGRDTRHGGLVTVTAGTEGHQTRASFMVEPGPATGSIPVRIGPRSIPADGQSEAMLVAFPADEWGNPVPADTAVTIRVQHPAPAADGQSGTQDVIKATPTGLLTWANLKSGTTAGQARVAVTAGQAHSPEKVFREVPGEPVTFKVNADRTQVPADGRQLVELTTSQITDQFGNMMLDGTSVTFLATAADGSRRSIPANVIDGLARAVLQAPTSPGDVTVQAVLAGVSSEPLVLSFTAGPAVEAIPLAAALMTDTLEIVAGPLVGPLGQFIPDGTPVTIRLVSGDRVYQEMVAPAYYGYASTVIRRAVLEPAVYEIQASAGTGEGQTIMEIE